MGEWDGLVMLFWKLIHVCLNTHSTIDHVTCWIGTPIRDTKDQHYSGPAPDLEPTKKVDNVCLVVIMYWLPYFIDNRQ